ncbi:MAG: hypothetical protein AAGG50_07520 [Bacteroidota bacterium]
MSITAPRPHRTAAEVNAAGIDALIRALGVADTARFLQQYGPGLGDYTAERDALIDDLSMEEVLRLAEEHDRGEEA